MGLRYSHDPVMSVIGFLIIVVVIIIVIAAIHQELTDPCVEYGPRELMRIDPETGWAHYRTPCVKRTSDL